MIAVNDGVIKKIGHSAKRGNYVVLQDAYGNTYTYSNLGAVARTYPVPKEKPLTAKDFELVKPKADRKPNAPASAGLQRRPGIHVRKQLRQARPPAARAASSTNLADRFSALLQLPQQAAGQQLSGRLDKLLGKRVPAYTTFRGYLSRVFEFNPKTTVMKPLRQGSKVVGGTILGRVGAKQGAAAPHITFEIRPAGRGAPLIDPKPILDGWKLLESTALYRVAGENPLLGGASVGQVLLMDKTSLERRVLADPHLEIYSCGRDDIQSGQVDRRVLATAEYLVGARLPPDADVAEVRPQLPHHQRQRQRALLRRRDGHRPGQRHPDPRPPGQGHDHRVGDQGAAEAPGADAAAPDHLADGHGRPDLRAARPRRPHPRRLQAALRRRRARQAVLAPAEAGPVAAPDRPHRGDPAAQGRTKASKYAIPVRKPKPAAAGAD